MVEWNKADGIFADGIFNVSRRERSMEFTGERMTTAVEGEIEFEHFHRYCLARDLCPGLDVLDVASGEGYGSSILANVARSVIGVDIDRAAIAHARTTYGGENLRFVQGSAIDLPLGDASVDAVVSFETLEHVRDHTRFMAEVKRVLRPGGRFIISTPERTVYSARSEPVNEFHVLELSLPEFDSLLRANFKYVAMLYQRAILGSLIVKTDGAGPWRSYERRSLDYIEASNGLARAPFLIAVASEENVSHIPSSVYLDRRRPGEVVGGYLQLPDYRSQAVEMTAEIGRLSEAVARRDVEIGGLSDMAVMRDAELRRMSDAISDGDRELSSVNAKYDAQIVKYDAQIVWLSDERARMSEERVRLSGQLDAHAAKLNELQRRFDKVTRSFAWRSVDATFHFPRTVGRVLRWPFVRIGYHKDGRPRAWLSGLRSRPGAPQSTRPSGQMLIGKQDGRLTPSAETLSTSLESSSSRGTPRAEPASLGLDERKATIFIVAHEATRSGAPILALNSRSTAFRSVQCNQPDPWRRRFDGLLPPRERRTPRRRPTDHGGQTTERYCC